MDSLKSMGLVSGVFTESDYQAAKANTRTDWPIYRAICGTSTETSLTCQGLFSKYND